MATKVLQDKGTEKITVSGRIASFLNTYRVALVTVLVVVAVAIVGLVGFTVITESKNNAAFETVETVLADWEAARAETDKSGLAAKEDEFIAKLQKVALSNRGSYAGARAYMTLAEIYFSRKDWKNAQENYLAAAKAAPRVYTAGQNFYNAGVCADESGNSDQAVEYFNKALASENFNLKTRVLFNLGRIEEQRSNAEAAIAAYEKLAEQYPDDDWTLIAKSRIIALQIK